MSALRVSRPGHPTELILLEPAVGRRQGYGGISTGFLGGTVIVTESERSRQLRMQRESMRKARTK